LDTQLFAAELFISQKTVFREAMEKIFANLKKGVVAPCYLLYGEEEYLVNENLNKMLDLLVPQSDRDLSLFFLGA